MPRQTRAARACCSPSCRTLSTSTPAEIRSAVARHTHANARTHPTPRRPAAGPEQPADAGRAQRRAVGQEQAGGHGRPGRPVWAGGTHAPHHGPAHARPDGRPGACCVCCGGRGAAPCCWLHRGVAGTCRGQPVDAGAGPVAWDARGADARAHVRRHRPSPAALRTPHRSSRQCWRACRPTRRCSACA
jgi:hypothetical protein